MNNESDYLWDKTGEPDPEIQKLEEIMGTLRYQPRPLDIPASISPGAKRSFFRSTAPSLAIAATIALIVLGLGLWLGLQRLQKPQPAPQAHNEKVAPPAPSVTDKQSNPAVASSLGVNETVPGPQRSLPHPMLAVRNKRIRNAAVNPEVAARRLQEAEAAKDQMMMAFRFVSAKLNYAQKKAQELNQRDQVHNQHKIG